MFILPFIMSIIIIILLLQIFYNRGGDVKVIVMGALARDFEQIAYIVSRLPQIHFYICKGRRILIICFQV